MQGARLPHLVSPMSPGQQAICSPAGVQGYCPSNTLDSEATDDGQGTSSADPLVCGSHDYIQSTFFCNSSQHDHVTAVGPTLTGGRLPWHAADGNLSRYCHGRMTPPIAADGSSRDSRQGLAWSLGSQSYPSQVCRCHCQSKAICEQLKRTAHRQFILDDRPLRLLLSISLLLLTAPLIPSSLTGCRCGFEQMVL